MKERSERLSGQLVEARTERDEAVRELLQVMVYEEREQRLLIATELFCREITKDNRVATLNENEPFVQE